MRPDCVITALALLSIGLSAVDVGVYPARAADRARREIFLSETRLDMLKRRIEDRTEPTYSAWLDLKSRADGQLDP